MIGDDFKKDVAGGKAAGMKTCWICADEKFKLKLIDIFKTLYQKNLDRIVLTEGRNEYYMERVLKLHYFIDQKTFLKYGFNNSKRLIEFLEG